MATVCVEVTPFVVVVVVVCVGVAPGCTPVMACKAEVPSCVSEGWPTLNA